MAPLPLAASTWRAWFAAVPEERRPPPPGQTKGEPSLTAWLDFREPVSAWTHGAWLLLSVPATLLLWRAARGDRAKRGGFLVFGLGLAACYAGSTVFHAVRVPPER